jgi:hypothetical protein
MRQIVPSSNKSLFKALILGLCLGAQLPSQAQYTATDSHTAEELAMELAGDGVTILNPILSCGDSVNGIFTGSGGLEFDEGIILSTGNTDQIFQDWYTTGGAISTNNWMTSEGVDVDMNNLLRQWGDTDTLTEAYATCALEFDLIPQAKTLKIDYFFATGLFSPSVTIGCANYVDIIAILIKGGGEYPEYTNIATIPGTDIPVNVNSIAFEGFDGCPPVEGGPYLEYKIGNSPLSEDFMDYFCYNSLTPVFSPEAAVSPCDTYHIKIAAADIRQPVISYQNQAISLFLKSGSLRTTGQPEDCPTTVDPEPPSSISEYLKQQAQIKVSPNPFNTGVAIAIHNDNGKELYNVALYDIGGRLLSQTNGNLNEVNASLAAIGNNLATGMYMLKIKSASGKYNHTVKVVKE